MRWIPTLHIVRSSSVVSFRRISSMTALAAVVRGDGGGRKWKEVRAEV